jgi:hypothetical protein
MKTKGFNASPQLVDDRTDRPSAQAPFTVAKYGQRQKYWDGAKQDNEFTQAVDRRADQIHRDRNTQTPRKLSKRESGDSQTMGSGSGWDSEFSGSPSTNSGGLVDRNSSTGTSTPSYTSRKASPEEAVSKMQDRVPQNYRNEDY